MLLLFDAKTRFTVYAFGCFFSELTLKIEIQRIDLIHLAQDLDLAVFQILRLPAIQKMAMLVLTKMSMTLMKLQHRMKAHCPTQDRERLVHPHKI